MYPHIRNVTQLTEHTDRNSPTNLQKQTKSHRDNENNTPNKYDRTAKRNGQNGVTAKQVKNEKKVTRGNPKTTFVELNYTKYDRSEINILRKYRERVIDIAKGNRYTIAREISARYWGDNNAAR